MNEMKPLYPYKEYNYWFIKDQKTYGSNHPNFQIVVKNKDVVDYRNIIGTVQENNPLDYDIKFNDSKYVENHDVSAIKTEFMNFLHYQPVALLGDIFNVDDMTDKDLSSTYDKLLEGAMFFRKYNDTELGVDVEMLIKNQVKRNIDWLHSTDFYTCPASTRYHDAEDNGLIRHTLRVYNNVIDIFKLQKFRSVNLGSAVLVALIHDWCKIGFYESYMKNVKDDKTGTWHKERAWTYDFNTLPVPGGHGATSMFYAVRMFNVNIQEAMAIRWHMGEYNVSDNESGELHECNERYPLVFMLQFADRLAITRY